MPLLAFLYNIRMDQVFRQRTIADEIRLVERMDFCCAQRNPAADCGGEVVAVVWVDGGSGCHCIV